MADRISDIRARLEAATPGPWFADGPHECHDGGHLASVFSPGSDNAPHIPHRVCEVYGNIAPKEEVEANFAFIANAPSDIAYLLERVADLEQASKNSADWASNAISDMKKAEADRDAALTALTGMVRWFGDYPGFIPAPSRSDEVAAAIEAARKLVEGE